MHPERYFAEMPEKRQVKARTLHALIMKLYPNCTVSLKYNMPIYESENGWLAIGNQKNHWSIYTCSIDKIADYLANNPGTKHAKGCINVRKKDRVDLGAMNLVIKNALQ